MVIFLGKMLRTGVNRLGVTTSEDHVNLNKAAKYEFGTRPYIYRVKKKTKAPKSFSRKNLEN
jgi:hypothetical protein